MKPILSKTQAIKLDDISVSSGHLSSYELMDNAGCSIAQYILEKIERPFSKSS